MTLRETQQITQDRVESAMNPSKYRSPTSGQTVLKYTEPSVAATQKKNSKKTFVKLNYILCCADEVTRPSMFNVSSNAFNYVPLENNRFYEKVRRENNIIVVRGGGEISVTASGF